MSAPDPRDESPEPEPDLEPRVGPGLYIVGTPIGHVDDISARALWVLAGVDVIFAEDTRTTGRLLGRHGIKTPLKSYRVHQEERDRDAALRRLEAGESLALCSEAGTPSISDPGASLCRIVREKLPRVPIVPVPGPSALAAALSVSGFGSSPSLFLGFLSPKPGRRRRELEKYTDFEGPIVLYESVHRILKTLEAIGEVFPGRDIFIAREMTKIYEEFILIKAGEIGAVLGNLTQKGEFTLIIGPP